MKTIYIGTYTKKRPRKWSGRGIYSVLSKSDTGMLKMGRTVAKVVNPL
jgi:6-phosphogluconolactonase (cycloisomerase 2 family)